MKTRVSVGFLALSFATAICFSSCTQDSELKPVEKEKTIRIIDARNLDGKTFEDLGSGDVGSTSDESGNIQLLVRPADADATIRIYNDQYDSGEIRQEADGMTFRYLSPGEFTIDITPANPAYAPLRIENVEVRIGTLTDLGEIML